MPSRAFKALWAHGAQVASRAFKARWAHGAHGAQVPFKGLWDTLPHSLASKEVLGKYYGNRQLRV